MKKIRWNPRLVTSLFITLLMCTLDCLAQEVIKGFVKEESALLRIILS